MPSTDTATPFCMARRPAEPHPDGKPQPLTILTANGWHPDTGRGVMRAVVVFDGLAEAEGRAAELEGLDPDGTFTYHPMPVVELGNAHR